MNNAHNQTESLHSFHVWDRNVRLFHWINLICILGLIGIGLVIFNGKSLGVSNEGKILLKTLHVYFGYVFALNLGWRLIWAFTGSKYARWKAFLPFGKNYNKQLGDFVRGARSGQPVHFLGHNPLGRLMVTLLLLLLSVQAVTGLVLAGTDIYFPPFGDSMKEWVAEDKTQLEAIKPYSKDNINENSYQAMRDFRKPFIQTHVYVFYTLLVAIFLHIAGVVVSELREKASLVSAMFTGKKVFAEKPVDADENPD